MVKKPIPAWLKNLPVMAHYHPGHMVSQHEDAVVRVVAANKHGWATIEWLDGQNRFPFLPLRRSRLAVAA